MNSEPIVVLLSDGRTINLQHVIATQRLTRVYRNVNPVSGQRERGEPTLEVIQNFGNDTFNPNVETHMLQVQTARGWDISILDKNDIALFDGAWMSYCLYASRFANGVFMGSMKDTIDRMLGRNP